MTTVSIKVTYEQNRPNGEKQTRRFFLKLPSWASQAYPEWVARELKSRQVHRDYLASAFWHVAQTEWRII